MEGVGWVGVTSRDTEILDYKMQAITTPPLPPPCPGLEERGDGMLSAELSRTQMEGASRAGAGAMNTGNLRAPQGFGEAKGGSALPPPPLAFRNHTGAPTLSPAGSQRAREPGALSIVLTHRHPAGQTGAKGAEQGSKRKGQHAWSPF